MTDDLLLLAAADPASASRWPDGPLDAAAEQHLRNLTSGEPAPTRGAIRRRRTARRALVASVGAGIAATLVVVITGGSGTPGSPPSVAVQPVSAPAPLAIDADAPVPSLGDLAAIAADRAAAGSPGVVRGSHVRSWSLGFGAEGEDFPAVVLPEEQLVAPRPDGGLSITRIPADPGRPAEVRLAAGRPAPADATIVAAAELATEPVDRTPPPADPAALAAHLAAVWAPAPPDPAGLIDALEWVLQRWTPGPAEDSAIAGWLAEQPGITALGAVTDRLGRPGVAYALDTVPEGSSIETRRTVVLDPGTGAVLSIELSFLADPGEWDVEPYAVISYVAYGVG